MKNLRPVRGVIGALFSLVLLAVPLAEANCPKANGIEERTPDSSFNDHGNGTVTHTPSGLMWAKCPQGRSGSDCSTGTSVRYNWRDALQQAVQPGLPGGYTDWRLPSRTELLSIVETGCKDPTINTAFLPVAFPMIPPNNQYWTSTPGLIGDASGRAWTVQFNTGLPSLVDKTALNYVRLVRLGGTDATYNRLTGNTNGPSQFDFTPQTGHNTSVWVESDIVTLAGVTGALPISVANGEYSVNGNAYTTAPGTVANGDDVQVQLFSAFSENTAKTATLTINGRNFDFTVTTGAGSEPNPVAFKALTQLVTNTVITSNTVTVTGLTQPRDISISGGTSPLYSIDGGVWTNVLGTISNGQKVAVRHTSASTTSTTRTTNLSINGRAFRFDITTERSSRTPTQPAPFVIPHKTNQVASTVITSDPVTITGITSGRNISVSAGGSYRYYNGTTWSGWLTTASTGVINNNYIVEVQRTSSATAGATLGTTLTVGSRSFVWNVITAGGGSETADLRFVNQNSVPKNARVPSEIILVDDLSQTRTISISNVTTGADGKYRISRDGFFDGFYQGVPDPDEYWINTAGRPLYNNSYVQVSVISSNTALAEATTRITVNGRTADFTVTSGSQLELPGPLYFEEVYGAATGATVTSNTGTVSGLSNTATASASNGTWGKNGGFPGTGTVSNGDQVALRMTAPACAFQSATSTLSLNGYPYNFVVWTGAGPVPGPFSFTSKTNQCLGVAITSDPSPGLQCITGSVPISVTNGRYSIDGGAYTAAGGNVTNTDVIRAEVTSSSSPNTTTTAMVRINGTDFPFAVTTTSTNPAPFSFLEVTGVCPNTVVASASSGNLSCIPTTYTATVSGGTSPGVRKYTTLWSGYAASQSVASGNQVMVQQTSSPTYGTTTRTNLTINGNVYPFDVSTMSADQPNDLVFPTKIEDPGTVDVTSASLTVSGLSCGAANISISGTGNPEYSINGSTTWRTSASTGITISNTNTLRIRLDAGAAGEMRTGAVNINGATFNYSVLPIVLTMANPPFTASTIEESVPVRITGLVPSPSTATVTSGGAWGHGVAVSSDGTNWSGFATSQSVNDGDWVKVRVTTSSTVGARYADLTINGGTVRFQPN